MQRTKGVTAKRPKNLKMSLLNALLAKTPSRFNEMYFSVIRDDTQDGFELFSYVKTTGVYGKNTSMF